MAEAENPLVPVQDKVLRIQARLLDFLRNVLSKIRPVMKSLSGFLANMKSAAKDIAKTVGKAAVDSVIKAGERLMVIVAFVEKQTLEALKMAAKTVNFLRKAIGLPDPSKAFKTVKAMVARLAKLFRVIVTKVFEVITIINPIDVALKLIDTMKMMLQMVFKWIGQVGVISSGVKTARKLINKSAKLLKAEAKVVTDLVKQTNKLKAA